MNELNSVFGDEALSRTSVFRWYGEFNRGRSSHQELREYQNQLLLTDIARSSCDLSSDWLGISETSIHSILLEHLTV